METKIAEGPEIGQVAPDETFANSVKTDTFTNDAADSICLVREEFGGAVPGTDGVSNLADKDIDIVGKLTLAQDRSVELERKLKHVNEKGEKMHFLEESLCEVEKEREAYEKFAQQTEKHSIETLEKALELDYLRVISECRAKEMEQMVSSLQEEVSGLHQKLDQYELTEGLNKRGENMTKDEKELKCSKDDLKHANMSEDSLARFKDLETALLYSQLKERELQESLIAAEEKARINENIANSTTESLFEVENLAEVLHGISHDVKDKLFRVEQDLKNASEREIELRTELEDNERKLLMQETTAKSATTRTTKLEQLLESQANRTTELERLLESQANRTTELEQLLESQANNVKMKLQETKEIYAYPEASNLSDQLNVLVDLVKESDEQASHSSVSALAKEIELQVLYAKLAEVETLFRNLQGQHLAKEDRAQAAEAECSFLADRNSKVNGDFTDIQVQMDELHTTLHQIERKKQSATYQVSSMTKSLNGLTEEMANERERLQKQISTLVSDNNDLKEKYLSIKNEMQYLLFKHESELTNANQREEILKGNLEDLSSRLGMHTAVDMYVAHLEKKFQPAETKSREQSEGLHSESRAASLGDFGRITTSDLMNDRTETPTEGLAEPIYHVGTSVNANATGHFCFNWKLMLAVCLVSVVIGLIQWNKFQSF